MAQATTYRRSVAGSMGAGIKSVMGGKERRFYILEHKISSKYHQQGETQRIIVDEIELGRDAKCQVRFDESFGTVSRRHAAIVKDGANWKLVQLSKTNSTYLNGHKVEKEWYLQSGDEIQLSTNGPKLGFIIPAGDKSLVKSIGMTARLSLFRQQALQPYKTALGVLASFLVVLFLFGGYYINELYQKNQDQASLIAENERRHQQEIQKQDSLLNVAKNHTASLQGELKNLKQQFKKVKQKQHEMAVATGSIDNEAINSCLPNIFFIYSTHIDVILPNGERGTVQCGEKGAPSWSGTGFCLDNGMFVTARHVVESWYYWNSGGNVDETMAQLNCIANNGGKVVAHFNAISSSGTKLQLTSQQFTCNRSKDRIGNLDDGSKISLAPIGNTDFAYCRVSQRNGLKFNPAASTQLERGTRLTVLGFPLGLGAESPSKINPIYGSGIISVSGLQKGLILTTDTNYEHGSSGGPVFYTDENGQLSVIGIVSAGAGRNTGFIVPIQVIQ